MQILLRGTNFFIVISLIYFYLSENILGSYFYFIGICFAVLIIYSFFIALSISLSAIIIRRII